MMPRSTIALTWLLVCAAFASAQPLPTRSYSPLLFVKLVGPPGMHAVVYQGRAKPRDLTAPAQLGLRAGYIYRVELNGFAGHPGLSLFPTLEVRGSLSVGPGQNPASFPAAVVITEDDIQKALAATLITKVIYLENPERATPAATTPETPVETAVPANRDPLAEARDYGRPVLVLRLGQLELTPQEVAESSVAGTILFPGETMAGPPAAPPMLPWACFPWYDPIIGPRPPEEECIHNGSINPPAPQFTQNGRPFRPGLDREGVLQGLNPEDTVAEYRDSQGRKNLTCSNRVCLCVPRFAVLRSELGIGRIDNVVSLGDQREVLGQEQIRSRVPSVQAVQTEQPNAFRSRMRPSEWNTAEGVVKLELVEVLQARPFVQGPLARIGTDHAVLLRQEERTVLLQQMENARVLSQQMRLSGTEQVVQTEVIGKVEGGAQVVTGEVETRDLTVCCNEAPRPPDKPLVLVKCADKQAAKPGDIVTFTLKYSNHGGRPITDVAVVDSLSGRLEYVPGTAQSDRDAVFTMQKNEAGSLILRWEVSGKLLAGDSGSIRFQARVR